MSTEANVNSRLGEPQLVAQSAVAAYLLQYAGQKLLAMWHLDSGVERLDSSPS